MYTATNTMHHWAIASSLPVHYTVVECTDLFAFASTELLLSPERPRSSLLRRIIVIDHTVDCLYGDRIRAYFDHHQVEYCILDLEVSEQSKTMDLVFEIIEAMDRFGISRRTEPIIAIGGGVLLDIVGLTASIYRRGTPYIRVPTTLLAIIDAGIGVKTSVNFQSRKNRIGTYYPPISTLIDRSFIKTLSLRHICNGLAEIIKLGIVKDGVLFELVELHAATLIDSAFQEAHVSCEVIRRAVQGMLEELEPNLWEQHLDRLMDFGHSFSPKIEMDALPNLLHGEAVAIDMAFSTQIAYQRNLLTLEDRNRIFNVLRDLRLPITDPLCTPKRLYEALQETVCHRDGFQRFPLPTGIGAAAFFNDITYDEISAAAEEMQRLGTTDVSHVTPVSLKQS